MLKRKKILIERDLFIELRPIQFVFTLVSLSENIYIYIYINLIPFESSTMKMKFNSPFEILENVARFSYSSIG